MVQSWHSNCKRRGKVSLYLPGDEPYYPINDEKNGLLLQKYQELTQKEERVLFGGRLGEYKYYDMDQVIGKALEKAKEILST